MVEAAIRSMSKSALCQGWLGTDQERVPAVVSSVAEDAGSERDTEPSSSMKSSLWPESEACVERDRTTDPLSHLRPVIEVDVPSTVKEAGLRTPLEASAPTPEAMVTGQRRLRGGCPQVP